MRIPPSLSFKRGVRKIAHYPSLCFKEDNFRNWGFALPEFQKRASENTKGAFQKTHPFTTWASQAKGGTLQSSFKSGKLKKKSTSPFECVFFGSPFSAFRGRFLKCLDMSLAAMWRQLLGLRARFASWFRHGSSYNAARAFGVRC